MCVRGARVVSSAVVKVRIRKTPLEREIDGVQLDRLSPGVVRNMSSSIATWLIVEGYAEPEMRRTTDEGPELYLPAESTAEDRRHPGGTRRKHE